MSSKRQNRSYQNTAQQAYVISSNWKILRQEICRIRQLFVNNNFPMSTIDNTVKTFLNEKMKPTIEPNQDKITTHDQINSELPNESITLIPLTSPSVPSQGINYLTNASNTLILPVSPSATSQEIDYLTNASRTVIPPPTSPSAPSHEIDYLTNASTTLMPPTSPSAPSQEIDCLTMPPSKLAKERPNQNIASSNRNP